MGVVAHFHEDEYGMREMELRTRTHQRVFLLMGVMLILAACGDRVVYVTPCLRTTIVDSLTKQPITNAKATAWQPGNPAAQVVGFSDKRGDVTVMPLADRAVAALNWDSVPPEGKVRVEASGYQTREVEVGAGCVETPPIQLTPAN